jgi:hypothetical protein
MRAIFSLIFAVAISGAGLPSDAKAQQTGTTTRTVGSVGATGSVWFDLDTSSGPISSSAASYYNDSLFIVDEQAYANLATGELRAYHQAASLAQCTCGPTATSGFAEAILNDVIYFNVANANPSTVTTIPFSFNLDGFLDDDFDQSTLPTIAFSGVVGSAFFSYQYQNGQVQSDYFGWDQFSFNLVNPSGNFQNVPVQVSGYGQLSFIGSGAALPFQLYLFIGGNGYSLLDFLNTAYVDLSPPAGVTMTSASGVFLTQPRSDQGIPAVPEPTSWMLMLLGFGAIGVAMRRSRNESIVRA